MVRRPGPHGCRRTTLGGDGRADDVVRMSFHFILHAASDFRETSVVVGLTYAAGHARLRTSDAQRRRALVAVRVAAPAASRLGVGCNGPADRRAGGCPAMPECLP